MNGTKQQYAMRRPVSARAHDTSMSAAAIDINDCMPSDCNPEMVGLESSFRPHWMSGKKVDAKGQV